MWRVKTFFPHQSVTPTGHQKDVHTPDSETSFVSTVQVTNLNPRLIFSRVLGDHLHRDRFSSHGTHEGIVPRNEWVFSSEPVPIEFEKWMYKRSLYLLEVSVNIDQTRRNTLRCRRVRDWNCHVRNTTSFHVLRGLL